MTDVRLVDIANEVDKPVSSLLREVISCNFQVLVPLKDLVDQRERAAKNLPKSLNKIYFPMSTVNSRSGNAIRAAASCTDELSAAQKRQ